MKPLRTALFAPGSKDRVMVKALESGADAVILDLEDSVPVASKGEARAMAADTAPQVLAELHDLLHTDVDEQRTNPLSVLRSAVRYPTALLARAGVPRAARDEFAEHAFPDDVYDLAPATWRDVDPSLHEPGIVWGAWKAATVMTAIGIEVLIVSPARRPR